MSWLMKGIQSAIFHYASCAPCTGYVFKKQRRKQAKQARKERTKLQLEQPDMYHHPEPTGTNPYWQEEIDLGPGPPPRRARRTNTGSQKGVAKMGTNSTVVSQGSSINVSNSDDMRLSDDTLDDDNWNRKRYQREDEDLWGLSDPAIPVQPTVSGSSVGVTGLTRPGTSRSMRSESYCTARVPPVNDLHPPIVSLPSPHPIDNRWMVQPPPKASVMSGKVRATHRSRSGSGASSRVELSLQRQVSAKQLRYKMERGETPVPPVSRGSSYGNRISGQRHDSPRAPVARPPSAASSRRRKRRDTAMTRTELVDHSSGSSSEARTRTSPSPKSTVASLHVVQVRSSRQQLSTVVSSNSEAQTGIETENRLPADKRYSTQMTESSPYGRKPRTPLASSDISSLNALQELVSPHALLNSQFVSAPLMEARIKLPPSDREEEKILSADRDWIGNGFAISREWNTEFDTHAARLPFDSQLAIPERDPRLRWSVDF
ncbi:hypothetical protein BS50DRAFT_147255 [Corynespora cassiicola Philippines]|uniref:Signal peptide-containing protein n=1 Tax=Corynespora cassiicola Philippines TaxID=1448308 RepID=A0A2T2N9F8_CORCC|nr:hypothetical protein BS50DRAFT_147255 [Corynespora cassiicola Philippines]